MAYREAPRVDIAPALARNVVGTWGDAGRRWLADLPATVSAVLAQWDLEAGTPYELSYHWVAPVTRADGSAAVLKLGLPGADHLAVEAAALGAYGGRGAVRLLEYDAAGGALLLERAEPGTMARMLVPHSDAEATAALVGVMRRLHAEQSPPATSLPDLREESESFARYLRDFPGDGPLPRRLVETAGRLLDELCDSAPARVVLHGDLHHDNVLQARREPWLAIDPHGVLGDPGYDLGAILYNPGPDNRDPALLALVPQRLEHLVAGAGMPRERVVAWCFVKAVLSDVWSSEVSDTPGSRAIDVAGVLEAQL